MRCNKTIILALAAYALSACATTRPALTPASANLGQATAHNMDAQKVAPTARQKEDTFIPADPARRALARKAYESGNVEDVKAPSSATGN